MKQAALKIQSTFRGKRFGKRKGASDDAEGDETQTEESSSAFDSNERASNEIVQDEEKSITDGIERSFERPQSYTQFNSDENNSRTGSAIFSGEPSPLATLCREDSEFNASIPKDDDTFDESNAMATSSGSSGEDKDTNRNSRDRFFMSIENENKNVEREYSPETGELVQSGDSLDNIDNNSANSAEAMYYSLKKGEIESQRLLADNIDEEEDSMLGELVKVEKVGPGRLSRAGMSLDERNLYKEKLLGLSDSILSNDYPPKSDDSPPEDFDPFSQASKQKSEFLSQLHGRSTDKNMELGEEDQFDDFYPGNIRQKIMASSVSIADSDYFDPNKIPAIDNDIKTALETINSSDSESTINSAATKIQAGARGFITRRRLQSSNQSTNLSTSQYASFGNAAIDKSLDEFIERQEQLKEEDEEDDTEMSSKSSKKLDSVEDSIDDSDEKNFGKGVIEIKLEQKKPEEIKHQETLPTDTAMRRMMLHREDAIQMNSTPSSDESTRTPPASCDKLIEKSSSTQETVVEVATI